MSDSHSSFFLEKVSLAVIQMIVITVNLLSLLLNLHRRVNPKSSPK